MATSTDPVVRWLDDGEQAAWRCFINGSRRLMLQLEHDLKAHGLAHDDYALLVTLSEAPDDRLRMAELADRSLESRSRLSHHIGRLEARSLVKREACPSDKRGLFAVLTSQGRALIENTAPHHVTGVREWFFDRVTPEELAAIASAFGRIDATLGPPTDGPIGVDHPQRASG